MKKIFKSSVVIFSALLMLLTTYTCRCDDSETGLKTFRGNVMNIDWVGSLLVCKGWGDDMTFHVPQGVEIRQGTNAISLEHLHQGDNVMIKYVDDPTGLPKAVSIYLNKSYPEF